MARKKTKIYEKVEITDIGAEGKAIAKVDELVLFVNEAIPGDIADLRVVKKKKNYREAVPVHYHKYSNDRLKPFCEHFGICGGCKWQHLPYQKQLYYKHKQVVDAIVRIGKLQPEEILPIVESDQTIYYRNKLEFTFSNRRWFTNHEMDIEYAERDNKALGFHVPRMFDRIVDIKHCWLQTNPSNQIRLALKAFALKHDYVFYDQRARKGFMRNIIIRTTSTGETMIILVFDDKVEAEIDTIFKYLMDKFPSIDSWMYMINDKLNDSVADLDAHHYAGRDFIMEQMEGLKFKIGAKSFYQTNASQAYKLYCIARAFAALNGSETVYDLYTGTGTIANFIALNAKKVIGIEYVPEAIVDAKINSEINNIHNTTFVSGDMKNVLTPSFIEKNGKPDVLITDPPRAGMHPSVIETIIQAKPKRIVYVSCNPATQARDINLLSEFYDLKKIQPLDMFPHTYHVENVALLTLVESRK